MVKPQVLRSAFAAATLVYWCMLAPAQAAVRLPNVLGSHMVLQQGMNVPIWGTAEPGEEVTVEFADQKKTAKADEKGRWEVLLDPLPVSATSRTLTVTGASGGAPVQCEDVLVGEVWVGSGQSNMQTVVNSYTNGDSVLLTNAAGTYPRLRLLRNGWQPASRSVTGGFSALLFSFGVSLQKELDVPIGLMVGAVGGTPSGYWLSEEAFKADTTCQEAVAKAAARYDAAQAAAAYAKVLAAWEKASEKAKAAGLKEPRKPEPALLPGASPKPIGNLYEQWIRPLQPFAIRGVLWDQGESGVAIGGVDQYSLMGALIRGWRKEWGQGDFPFLYVQKPSGGGCAWDLEDPVTRLAEKFTPLPAEVPPVEGGSYRETHLQIQLYPNTAMVTATDLGPGVHPVCKSGYGARAARVALGTVYQRAVEVCGPAYRAHVVEGAKVRIQFDHVGQGLAFRPGDRLQGFALAGTDKLFHWADAVIEGDTVVVSSPNVAAPQAVRYAWATKHPWANLFNKDGLPALMFRTDDW